MNIKLTKKQKQELYLLFHMMTPHHSLVKKVLTPEPIISITTKQALFMANSIKSYMDPLINKEMKEDGIYWDYDLDKRVLKAIQKKLG